MSEVKSFVGSLPWDDRYRIDRTDSVMTPALVIYPDAVDHNIKVTLGLLGNDPNRWRPHVKTAKIASVIHRLIELDVRTFKCATTLELIHACEGGATDVLLAYPVMGANAQRVLAIANQYQHVAISVRVETSEQLQQWRGSRIGIFVDINPGMNRTGIPQEDSAQLLALTRSIAAAGLHFRGLHYYDGHLGSEPVLQRTETAHRGYDRLMQIVDELSTGGIVIEEVITSGTPSFPCAISYQGFHTAPFVWRASPGTVVYSDATSLAQLPDLGYRPAALVLTRIVSHPRGDIVTCDAGHKSVSADAGVPTCLVLGHPELLPASPSEEHLPLQVTSGRLPSLGELLYLVPRHVCPTVNNFDYALMAREGRLNSVEKVSARGREKPIDASITQLSTTKIC
jgi:D-serine deaminase-like pyridoxal phosphate-dependent protein